jgi:hypothetical protein
MTGISAKDPDPHLSQERAPHIRFTRPLNLGGSKEKLKWLKIRQEPPAPPV